MSHAQTDKRAYGKGYFEGTLLVLQKLWAQTNVYSGLSTHKSSLHQCPIFWVSFLSFCKNRSHALKCRAAGLRDRRLQGSGGPSELFQCGVTLDND